MWILENAFLIPLIPAISFVVILLFGRSVIGVERVQKVGITAVGIVWILSMIAAVSWITRVEDSTSSGSDDASHALVEVNEGLSAAGPVAGNTIAATQLLATQSRSTATCIWRPKTTRTPKTAATVTPSPSR